MSEPIIERNESGGISVKLPRGARVAVDNRTTGRITVTGWDRDTVEARAISERGVEYVRVRVNTDSSGTSLSLKADYASEGFLTSLFDFGLDEVHLEVKLPSYAEVELIKVNRSNVEVIGIETHVAVEGGRSAIKLNSVGSAEIRTKSGHIEVEKVSGLIDVITTSGKIRVREAGSDVRALSISGDVEIRCARGRVNVGNTDGSITLSGVDGDVDVVTTNSGIRLTGAIRRDGRYHLKSMSGLIEMFVRPNPAGFTAVLSSYRGKVEAGFPMKIARPAGDGNTNHRLVGRYGSGQAQLTLDSFEGDVRLIRAPLAEADPCR
jgi:hypothetical protein